MFNICVSFDDKEWTRFSKSNKVMVSIETSDIITELIGSIINIFFDDFEELISDSKFGYDTINKRCCKRSASYIDYPD